ncbi:MAG: hypothetical protein ACFE7E_07245 [Candidatus Hodarchaeota archaeon]
MEVTRKRNASELEKKRKKKEREEARGEPLEVDSIILENNSTLSKPVQKAKSEALLRLTPSQKTAVLNKQAEMYACIATLESIIISFKEARIEPTTYKRQVRALMRGAFKAKGELEELNIDVARFLEDEGITKEFPLAVDKLKLAEGETGALLEILAASPATVAAKTLDITTNLITVMDLARLRDVARIDMLVPRLDELLRIMKGFPGLNGEYWVIKEIKEWRDRLMSRKPSDIISEEEAERLGFQADRWLKDFGGKLKEVSEGGV